MSRAHPVDPSRGTQADNVDDYRAGYLAGAGSGGGGGGGGRSGCLVLLLAGGPGLIGVAALGAGALWGWAT